MVEGEVAVVVFFDNESDCAQGDATLDAMSPGETPRTRASVAKYEAAVRRAV